MEPNTSPDIGTPKVEVEQPTTGYSPFPAKPQEEPVTAPAVALKPAHFELTVDSGDQVGTYLPEYLVQLILLVVIIGAVSSLLAIGIDSLIPSAKQPGGSLAYTVDLSSFQLTWALASLVSALPIFGWLFFRTKKVEFATPAVRGHRWRRGFLGAFLVTQILSIVSTIGYMLFDLIGRMVGGDDSGVFSYFTSGAKTPWWQVVIVSVLTVVFVGFVVFVMARDYKKSEV